MVVLGKFLLFRPGGMKVLCMDVDVKDVQQYSRQDGTYRKGSSRNG